MYNITDNNLEKVENMEWKDLMKEYLGVTFTNTTERLVRKLNEKRFHEVYNELQKRKKINEEKEASNESL